MLPDSILSLKDYSFIDLGSWLKDFSFIDLGSWLADIIQDGKWKLPTNLFTYFPYLCASIEDITHPKVSYYDKFV